MLIFNCTKAAAEFFTVTRKGEKQTCIEAAPHKTIAESIENPVFPDDVDAKYTDYYQWQWVVHCLSIKRKKYLLVMDYHSRYCLVLPAGKKGDGIGFLNTFEQHIRANFHALAEQYHIDSVEVEACLDEYQRRIFTCAFHQRGDRSVQSHLNDVAWHVERHCYEDYPLESEMDCMGISLYCGQIPRSTKQSKDYFYPNQEFVAYWRKTFTSLDDVSRDNVIDLSQYRVKS